MFAARSPMVAGKAAVESVRVTADSVEELEQEPKKQAAAISLTGGSLPRGLSLQQAEKALTDQLGKKLQKLFKEWQLTKLTVELRVRDGKVTKVTFSDYKSKKLDEEALGKIFKQLKLESAVTGTVKLMIVYL